MQILENQFYWKLIYDEECPLCRRFAGLIKRFNRGQIENISFQRYHPEEGKVSLEDLQEDVHLIGKNGEVLRGADALNKILTLVPESKPLRWIAESRWGKKSGKVLYSTMKFFRRCSKC